MADEMNGEREAAEAWLRARYGAYRGHFAWRELEEAFIAGRASLAASAGSEPVAWPKDAADVRAFIGSQFERLQYGKENGVPHENDRYTLTSHDILSAFRWWSENLPSPTEGMAGWKLVPIEPTPEMVEAGRWMEYGESSCHMGSVPDGDVIGVWQSMIAAAPPLPASEAKEL